jgi:hypothetical protein
MNERRTASGQIIDEVTSWPGVEAVQGDRGELSFRVGRREIGHLHGDRTAHFGFPKAVWTDLHEQGRIDYHPVFPGKPGFGARIIENPADINDVIALLRLNYDRTVATGFDQRGRKGNAEDAEDSTHLPSSAPTAKPPRPLR